MASSNPASGNGIGQSASFNIRSQLYPSSMSDLRAKQYYSSMHDLRTDQYGSTITTLNKGNCYASLDNLSNVYYKSKLPPFYESSVVTSRNDVFGSTLENVQVNNYITTMVSNINDNYRSSMDVSQNCSDRHERSLNTYKNDPSYFHHQHNQFIHRETSIGAQKEETECAVRFTHERTYYPPVSIDSLNKIQEETYAVDNSEDFQRRKSLGTESLQEYDSVEETENDLELPLPFDMKISMDYSEDIFKYKRRVEPFYHRSDCLAKQPQVTDHMRCIMVNWLLKVNKELQFGQETLFLAVNHFDRFLAQTEIAQDCLQLLATTALFVAAKMEESKIPWTSDLVRLCGRKYKKHHFRRMEMFLIKVLRFWMHAPTSYFFMNHLILSACQLGSIDRRVAALGRYVLESVLSNYKICQYYPSQQAAATLQFASMWILNQEQPYVKFPSPSLTLRTLSIIKCVIQDFFKEDELIYIENCYALIEDSMKPFLQSNATFYTESNPGDQLKEKNEQASRPAELLSHFQPLYKPPTETVQRAPPLYPIYMSDYRHCDIQHTNRMHPRMQTIPSSTGWVKVSLPSSMSCENLEQGITRDQQKRLFYGYSGASNSISVIPEVSENIRETSYMSNNCDTSHLVQFGE